MNYVIIGNSVAAVGAIRGIRNIDPQGNITVISRERHIAYGRPLISYLLGGLVTEKRMAYLPEDFYEKNRVNLLLNSEVVGVNSEQETGQSWPEGTPSPTTGSSSPPGATLLSPPLKGWRERRRSSPLPPGTMPTS